MDLAHSQLSRRLSRMEDHCGIQCPEEDIFHPPPPPSATPSQRLPYHLVNTEFNHQRLLKSRGPDALRGLSSFRFETIPDGLPPSDIDATQDVPSLCDSAIKNCLAPFRDLLSKLNDSASSNVPPVTCVVSDGAMSFTLTAAEELRIPEVLFWTTSACGFMDWIPGGISLKDIPTFIRTTNRNDIMLNYVIREIERAQKASAIILNTFDALEHDVLDALSSFLVTKLMVGENAKEMKKAMDWNFISDEMCVLCSQQVEDINHLFWKCEFTKKIWKEMGNKMQITPQGNSWKQFLDYAVSKFKGRMFKSKLRKLGISVAVYMIWRERNNRIFTQ
ncbi:hypothetical protein RJ639_008903 [Escallonia herrerae]|uniref:Reverse transcriptase zinc-binding domain-containing protein n=1 Tax=Escallonia herrerae TaxID=1293975 RepID=A0AA88VSG3_9ASTE|nr:hypothetical protein RJ639_008903 [Escallonia herrerae]